MALSKEQKQDIIAHLKEQMECMKGMVIVDYKSISDKDIKLLRQKASEENIEYKVVKKTLLQRALNDEGIKLDTKKLEGQIAYALSCDDEVAPAKIAAEFAKDHEEFKLLAGILEKEVLSDEQIIALSKLPSKDEMRGQLARTLQAPISGFVNVLSGNMRSLVNVLNAVKDQKGENA